MLLCTGIQQQLDLTGNAGLNRQRGVDVPPDFVELRGRQPSVIFPRTDPILALASFNYTTYELIHKEV